MCPTFILFDFVGAVLERPRANEVRPYEVLETLINQGLLACLFDSNSYCDRHSDHGVVAGAERASNAR